jgi:hypothetical protein
MSKAMLAETKGEEVAAQTEEEMLEEDKAYIEQVFLSRPDPEYALYF